MAPTNCVWHKEGCSYQGDVEERAVVQGPRYAARCSANFGELCHFSSIYLLDIQMVLLLACQVHSIRQSSVVCGHLYD